MSYIYIVLDTYVCKSSLMVLLYFIVFRPR